MKLLKATQRSNIRIACRELKTIVSLFNIGRNSIHKAEALTKALIEICIKNSSAEQCLTSSPDTMLRRLHQLQEDAFNRALEKQNARLLRKLGLRRRAVMAFDFRTLPYYGGSSQRSSAIHAFRERGLA